VEVHWKRKDGTPILIRAHVRPVENEVGNLAHFETIAEDITQQRAFEEQVRQLQKMESLALLAGGVAHDFNNILCGVLGYGQLVLRTLHASSRVGRFLSDEQSRREVLERATVQVQHIVDAAIHGRSLTGQLLSFSRDEALPIYPINLDVEIDQIQDMVRRLIGENIEVAVRVACKSQKVLGEQGAFAQALLNLCVNARDAMPRGGRLTISTFPLIIDSDREEHPGIPRGNYVVLQVSDTGCGMDKNVQKRIFEPFFTTKPAGRGTGLGLYSVYAISRRSGGHIRVHSDVGIGSTFWLYFPVVDSPAAAATPIHSEPSDTARTGLVMVVEDDARLREMVRNQLEYFGFQVVCARSAGTAVQDYDRLAGGINVLMTDVVMPELSGPDLVSQLRQKQPNLKVVYMTGWAPAELLSVDALGEGIELLRKPFSMSELSSTLCHVLAS
jgi:two-component system cell cycle sensor histidine kinase/response regulator CckA